MGWAWMLLIGGAAFGVLRRLSGSSALTMMIGAAILVGAAGYGWQQHASLVGHPVRADTEGVDIDPGLSRFRAIIMPGEPGDAAVLDAADERLRQGQRTAASQGILDALAGRPNDAALWAGLGSAIAAHDGGQVSPTAQFVFSRALQLAPDDPGPPFLLGLAYLQAGEMAAAKAAWLRALSLAPRDAPYRVDIAERLVMIDQYQAMQAGGPAKP